MRLGPNKLKPCFFTEHSTSEHQSRRSIAVLVVLLNRSLQEPASSSAIETIRAESDLMAPKKKSSKPSGTAGSSSSIALPYRAFFLYIEPVATAAGAYYAALQQQDYMTMTLPLDRNTLAPRESIVLYQLANLYFVFALNEALVLRMTNDRRVWSAFLLGLLIADFGHLASVQAVGWEVYYQFWTWNAMYWGNLGFVYIGAMMRSAFLLGIGS